MTLQLSLSLRDSELSLFAILRGFLKARLHRQFLSQQLDAIFVAPKLHQVSNMFETPAISRATNRTKHRTWFTRAILKLQP